MNPLLPLPYLLLFATALLAAVAGSAWYATRELPRATRLVLCAARTLAVAGLLALAFNPGAWRERMVEQPSVWALLLDRSASMATPDAARGRTRWQEACAIARAAREASTRPARIRTYTFADGLEPAPAGGPDRLPADGGATRLVDAGVQLLAREQDRNGRLTGILLLSDGRQPDPVPADAFALRAAARAAPVYPVVLGGPVPRRDLELRAAQHRQVSFLGQPVTIAATLHNNRMGPLEARVVLRDAAGAELAARPVQTTNTQIAPVSFDLRPSQPGYFEYTLETPVRDNEADTANNMAGIGVFVLTERLHILILEGEPHWDTKFLSHLLRGQTNMSVSAVFRVREDRFFKVSSDAELTAATADAFPATDDDIRRFDLVVIGRGSEYLFDAERTARLDRFVREFGGCVLFARGKSYNGDTSPLRDLEPMEWGGAVEAPYALRPLLAGEQAGLFGGLLPGRDHSAWSRLPPLERGHRTVRLRSFATVLAEGVPASGGDAFPGLVSRRLGRGLVLLVNGDGLWKWGFFPLQTGDDAVYRDLWVRLFQWAVSFAEFNPGADFAIRAEPAAVRAAAPIAVRVGARAHASATQPGIGIYRGERLVQSVALSAQAGDAGQWLGVTSLAETGLYRLTVTTNGVPVAGAQTTVQVLPPPGERDDLSADAPFLAELAARSGGRVIAAADVPDLVRTWEQPVRANQPGDIEWAPSWDRPWIAALLLAGLALEWYGRRRKGLL